MLVRLPSCCSFERFLFSRTVSLRAERFIWSLWCPCKRIFTVSIRIGGGRGVMFSVCQSTSGGVVPYLQPITLPLVPCPFRGRGGGGYPSWLVWSPFWGLLQSEPEQYGVHTLPPPPPTPGQNRWRTRSIGGCPKIEVAQNFPRQIWFGIFEISWFSENFHNFFYVPQATVSLFISVLFHIIIFLTAIFLIHLSLHLPT